jgi:hypothetical protein
MYRPLNLPHPHAWLETRDPFRWDAEAKKKIWKPTHVDALADEYESHLFGLMLSHALRLSNLDWERDDDTEATLTRDLQHHAIAAGRRVGVRFIGERSNAARTIAGDVSARWLRRASAKVAALCLDYWDPAEAQRRHDAAVRGGSTSKRGPTYSLGMTQLPKVPSVPAIMEALSCSRSTAKRLRRRALATE